MIYPFHGYALCPEIFSHWDHREYRITLIPLVLTDVSRIAVRKMMSSVLKDPESSIFQRPNPIHRQHHRMGVGFGPCSMQLPREIRQML